MNQDELAKYAQENGERFWKDAGNHWLNDGFHLLAEDYVVEVGGYLGNWANYIENKYECRVRVFEPVKEFYDAMVKRFSNRSKIEVVNAAVDNFDGESHIAVMDEGSTFFTPGVSAGPIVHVMDIDRIVREASEVSLLALNCEGSEYGIIDRLIETGEIRRIDQLLVQFHVKYPEAFDRRAKIRERMAATHWERMYYPFMWESWRRR